MKTETTSVFQCNEKSNYITIESMSTYGLIVVFVTDIFWQLSIRSSSTVMILSIVSLLTDHATSE